MTFLLDIAALSALLLTLSFVPVLGLRHEARITRQIREADAAREIPARPALEDEARAWARQRQPIARPAIED